MASLHKHTYNRLVNEKFKLKKERASLVDRVDKIKEAQGKLEACYWKCMNAIEDIDREIENIEEKLQ